MRRTTLALSALALISTLGACSTSSPDQASDTGGGDSQSRSSDSTRTFHKVSGLVSQTSNSMDSEQTVTMETEIEGGGTGLQGSMFSAMGGQTCQIDLGANKMGCDGAMPMVMTEKAVYFKMPGSSQNGKPWTKTSLDSADMSGNMGQLGSIRQYSDIETMLPEGSTIENTEREKLNGKQATRYEIVTNLSEATAQSGSSAQKLYEFLREQGIEQTRKTVWIGPNDLLMKVESTNPSMEIAGQKIPEITTKVTYSDWGEPVDITVPPAEKVQSS
ncbi:hypothetical protein SAMN04487905_107251 [Actinopolyspora xinjiangensis]|uniref:Lipoprotein n=1 Tax=Actinopolyspora xinjiangensis TaxID=405564 RepID=A0A1H0V0C9_9ACTN|nr:hypothetical protein [Actinopolyspora xinjiangensis]SDP71648.1 hypothetical protein SAMN04487905_107251 [Actinopolyspora xinjiangensis]